jgi:endo-1,4-beta-xylanase
MPSLPVFQTNMDSKSRRRFLQGLSATSHLALAPRTFAETEGLPSLRRLAGGAPLIGAAVPTNFEQQLNAKEIAILAGQFGSVTQENCMKWQFLCPVEGEYRFDPLDRIMDFAKANQQKVVGHTLIFNRDGNYPGWLFRDGEKEADAKLVWKRIEAHAEKLMGRYKGRIDSWDVLNEFIEVPDPNGTVLSQLSAISGEIDGWGCRA